MKAIIKHKKEKEIDVKACPFCGDGSTLVVEELGSGDWFWQCQGCGVNNDSHYTHEDALENWNTRA